MPVFTANSARADTSSPSVDGPVERIGCIADVIASSGAANEALGRLTPEVVDKLHEQMNRMLAKPDTREKFASLGMEAGTGTPEQLAQRIAVESARWSDVVRKRNIKAE